MSPQNLIHTRLWEEEAEEGDPFTASTCYCSGYDVYGEILKQASYPEYLYLLFRGERPTPKTARALEILAIAMANPGPRDTSVHAAMCASVGGSPAAAALMAALASGAGVSGGAREVFLSMQHWAKCATRPDDWQEALHTPPTSSKMQVWPDAEHLPGFMQHGQRCPHPVELTLNALAEQLDNGCIAWLASNREILEHIAGRPLAMTGLLAAALTDLGFSPASGEMLTLLLRLPGAAAHAIEQADSGFRHFPFFSLDILNDPANKEEGTL